ncbi:SDR family NAD(P)-dependent oxidoreductase [Bacillus niameyensis]|uniref:SDR family NAD(P)-dependent oxidoreductase n=1 Tax=Bacillus niameyensis TaxID=1522308 RepID=UPI000780E7F7|nr:glucose 1-dehydrogenase [Bacillus niameyensis]
MYEDLKGKVVFITGAGSGIGKSTALSFAQQGANIFVVDINETEGKRTKEQCEALGVESAFIKADVSSGSEVEEAVRTCLHIFHRIDIGVNNAGICIGGLTAKSSEEDFDKIISVNLKGTWLCMKHQIQAMTLQGGGVITNTSSIAGLIGLKHHAAYGASKHGIIGLTKTAAVEYASKGIRVNAVCPGTIHTDWVGRVTAKLNKAHPIGRIGMPEEVAEAIVWLSSEKSSFVTGQSLVVDGGRISGEN